jgi:hypothetical protein
MIFEPVRYRAWVPLSLVLSVVGCGPNPPRMSADELNNKNRRMEPPAGLRIQ